MNRLTYNSNYAKTHYLRIPVMPKDLPYVARSIFSIIRLDTILVLIEAFTVRLRVDFLEIF